MREKVAHWMNVTKQCRHNILGYMRDNEKATFALTREEESHYWDITVWVEGVGTFKAHGFLIHSRTAEEAKRYAERVALTLLELRDELQKERMERD